jgi:hypothetical protein
LRRPGEYGEYENRPLHRSAIMHRITLLLSALFALIALIVASFVVILPQWVSDNALFNAELLLRSAGRSGHGLVRGADNWLFYRNSLLSIVIPWPGQNAERIIAFRDTLQSHGIEFIMVPVPNKEFVYPEKICPHVPHVVCKQRDRLFKRLQENGVHVVDLLPLFLAQKTIGEPLYDALDAHWMDRAIRLGAKSIADTIRSLRPFQSDTMRFVTRDTIENHCADLVRLRSQQTDCDTTYPVQRSSVRTFGGSPLENDPDSKILIFGDSHINMGRGETADIGSHIGMQIGTGVRVMWKMKALNDASRYFQDHKAALCGKTGIFVLIFASRSLAEPIR